MKLRKFLNMFGIGVAMGSFFVGGVILYNHLTNNSLIKAIDPANKQTDPIDLDSATGPVSFVKYNASSPQTTSYPVSLNLEQPLSENDIRTETTAFVKMLKQALLEQYSYSADGLNSIFKHTDQWHFSNWDLTNSSVVVKPNVDAVDYDTTTSAVVVWNKKVQLPSNIVLPKIYKTPQYTKNGVVYKAKNTISDFSKEEISKMISLNYNNLNLSELNIEINGDSIKLTPKTNSVYVLTSGSAIDAEPNLVDVAQIVVVSGNTTLNPNETVTLKLQHRNVDVEDTGGNGAFTNIKWKINNKGVDASGKAFDILIELSKSDEKWYVVKYDGNKATYGDNPIYPNLIGNGSTIQNAANDTRYWYKFYNNQLEIEYKYAVPLLTGRYDRDKGGAEYSVNVAEYDITSNDDTKFFLPMMLNITAEYQVNDEKLLDTTTSPLPLSSENWETLKYNAMCDIKLDGIGGDAYVNTSEHTCSLDNVSVHNGISKYFGSYLKVLKESFYGKDKKDYMITDDGKLVSSNKHYTYVDEIKNDDYMFPMPIKPKEENEPIPNNISVQPKKSFTLYYPTKKTRKIKIILQAPDNDNDRVNACLDSSNDIMIGNIKLEQAFETKVDSIVDHLGAAGGNEFWDDFNIQNDLIIPLKCYEKEQPYFDFDNIDGKLKKSYKNGSNDKLDFLGITPVLLDSDTDGQNKNKVLCYDGDDLSYYSDQNSKYAKSSFKVQYVYVFGVAYYHNYIPNPNNDNIAHNEGFQYLHFPNYFA